jgi:hypothetical protein
MLIALAMGRRASGAVGEGRSRFAVNAADRNFKGPFYTLGHVRDRLKRDTRVLERGLGSVGGEQMQGAA